MAESGMGAGEAPRRRSVLENVLGPIAALCLFGMMALTFATVIARYFLDSPIAGDSEVQAFLLGLIIFSALPLVTHRQRHIAVHAFAMLLKGRARGLQRVFVLALTSIGFAFIAYLIFLQGQTLGSEGITTNYLNIPEAPFAYAFAALTLLAALMAGELLYRHLRGDASADRSHDDETGPE
ncbi:MAG TPA: TRAP transporter small permease [Stellaceae bacterium]|nr:TRAP transporter small permease [Stellaceae bacterium]